MSSATTHLPTDPPPYLPHPARPLATLDQLYEMTSIPEERIVIRDVNWAYYEQLVDSIPPGVNIHADYDGRDIELMAPGAFHDGVKKHMGRFVELVSEELDVPFTGLGQTTWKRPQVTRGLEADECYFFEAEKLTMIDEGMRRMSEDVVDYPNPDLSVEVDVSRSKIDRPGIYAALGVAEVWRFDGKLQKIAIDRLTAGGTYEVAETSRFLPVNSEEVGRWVLQEDARDSSQWARRLRAWVRAELAPRSAR